MRHKRSEASQQRRFIKQLVLQSAFYDRQRCETVCRTTGMEVLALLSGPVEVGDVPDVAKGEVLVDSRGQGEYSALKNKGVHGMLWARVPYNIPVSRRIFQLQRSVKLDTQRLRTSGSGWQRNWLVKFYPVNYGGLVGSFASR